MLLAFALAACQPVPRPFEGFAPPERELLALPDRGGIVVLPVAEAPPAAAEGLAHALAAALRDVDVPAVTEGGNRESAFLQGSVIDLGHDAHIVWELFASDGRPIGQVEQMIEGTPIAEWAAGDAELMAALAERGAGPIAGLIQGEVVVEAAAPRVALAPVVGAPGDGNLALTAAMRAALAREIEVVTGDATALRIAGRVQVGAAEDGLQPVAITWSVLDASGAEVGQVSQSNSVPAGSLDGAWGEVAVFVADWAAAGILDLLQEARMRAARERG